VANKPAGLYLHIPFCQSKCAYCDFYSYPATESAKNEYVSALIVALKAFAGQARHTTFDSIYLGGGTPTLLENPALQALLHTIFAYYKVAEAAEITLEANPGTVSDDRWKGLVSMGFNRLSLGMQSAKDSELAALGRAHSFADTVSAVKNARDAGFTNIALDLMLGIPGQTKVSLQESLEALAALNPEHVSAYLLKCEEGTPFYRRYPNGKGLPTEEEQAEFYLMTCEFLAKNGYWQEEISNFAKPGKESVHNQKYWTLTPYLGLGPSAYSDFGGKRFFFPAETKAFCQAAKAGNITSLLEIEDETPNRLEETVFLALRTGNGLTRSALCDVSKDGNALFDKIAKALKPYTEKGLVHENGESIRLTSAGFLLANALMTEALLAMRQ
jgi:oxygen-independent coproporphyrinogen-3 oxidase